MLYCSKIKDHQIMGYTKSEKMAELQGWTTSIEESDTEVAYDGSLWEKGYAPEKPVDVRNKERLAELKAFLSETDYVSCKLTEAIDETELQDLKEKYKDVLKKRREARAEINELEK